MARTVTDAAILLGALTGVDPRDPATARSAGNSFTDYTRFLDPDGLKGARIGLPFGAGGPASQAAIQALRAAGAEIVSPAPMPSPSANFAAIFEVMLYEFKAGLNAYLATRTGVPIRTLADAITFNEAHAAEEELGRYGQEIFLEAQQRGSLADSDYLAALDQSHRRTREELDTVLDRLKLDAFVAADLNIVAPLARAGYPVITVPAGINNAGLPEYLHFAGRAFSEPTLLRLAYAFEQASRARRPPQFLGA